MANQNTNKTHCIHGHPFDEVNTYVTPEGERACRRCLNDRKRERRARERLLRSPRWPALAEPRGGVIAVPLSGGTSALIDAADLPLVADYNWRLLPPAGYAASESRVRGVRRRLYMHRLILPPPDGLEVDHVNRDRLDNRRANLRLATRREQTGNTGMRSNNTSGYRGVSRSKNGLWQATIRDHGRSRNLGATWATPEMAARAYDAAAVEVFGEFASLNFPEVAA